jgi:serine/threonine protein kinase
LGFYLVKIKGILGKGGEGDVYVVEDPDTNQEYALKKISIGKKNNNVISEMEILMNKNLHHINLVRYFTFFLEKETANIIMELCEEGNLENYSKKFEDNIIPEFVLKLYLFLIFSY